jgi:hypothetical protein
VALAFLLFVLFIVIVAIAMFVFPPSSWAMLLKDDPKKKP